MFSGAIVRTPCPEMIYGITSSGLGKPDHSTALRQHVKYIEALAYCGLSVQVLQADSSFPDSTFIEDTALCTPGCAVITVPGADSRKGETAGLRDILNRYFRNIEEISPPGTLEGGDIMMAGNHYFIGISQRTNDEGASQLIDILTKYGFTGSKVPLKSLLHLKSGASYLENNNLLIASELAGRSEFQGFRQIIVDMEESYAANSLWINGKVIVPLGFPGTRRKIEKEGYETLVLDVSEFRKLDGGLSCLSLRF